MGSITCKSDGSVAIITIDRPSKRNALTAQMCEQLRQALESLNASDHRVGLLCAEGETFCAGADLNAPPDQFWQAMPGVGLEVSKPLIAAVQGPVVGMGLALVAFCDLCVASETTRFLYPEARVGVSKGLISALTARIPHKIAMEFMLHGGPVTAERAYDVGLVNRVTAPGDQYRVALDMAHAMAAHAPLVMAQLKRLAAQTLPVSPAETLYRTQKAVDQVIHSEDAAEGLRAFHERRPARFQGR